MQRLRGDAEGPRGPSTEGLTATLGETTKMPQEYALINKDHAVYITVNPTGVPLMLLLLGSTWSNSHLYVMGSYSENYGRLQRTMRDGTANALNFFFGHQDVTIYFNIVRNVTTGDYVILDIDDPVDLSRIIEDNFMDEEDNSMKRVTVYLLTLLLKEPDTVGDSSLPETERELVGQWCGCQLTTEYIESMPLNDPHNMTETYCRKLVVIQDREEKREMNELVDAMELAGIYTSGKGR